MATMHEVDYKIYGDDMQFVEMELDPQEAAIAEAGGMMSSLSERSNRRSSAARAFSLPPCAGRGVSGCNRCR